MDKEKIQRDSYVFPYHFIPNSMGIPKFSRFYGFAPSWLAAQSLLSSFLAQSRNGSSHHLDVGCGDGALISGIADAMPQISFTGVDLDERAIDWAKTLGSPKCVFKCCNVTDLPDGAFDSISLIEVLEHIQPTIVPDFLEQVLGKLKADGSIFVTVPSNYVTVNKKHYQHFSVNTLMQILPENLKILEVYGFQKDTLISKFLTKLVINQFFYFESNITSSALVNNFKKKYFDARKCSRIALVAKKSGFR